MTMAADLAFGKGSYTLTKTGKSKLAQLVPTLQAGMSPGSKIVVYGYTDNTPVAKALMAKGIADNLDLSSKRANEVVRFLIAKGIDPNIISAKGRGDTHPIAPNDTPKGRAENRRIEVVVEQPTG
jgi:chemotaxis protein MotB